ncbi:hypothetical protein DOTSEDRAFT_21781 [Dothistroma septosporum NZE10]|uniref:Uncharacterized protein n=1 Tax=Dothistroma septosporum (strain NZE10 / CBS 128990) TaxID=675120 RepID=N1PYL4_DOTSN|nr:hypothetical protein DOTSEDRAFT_21781 [Dothistroma septosporum NZE10]
MEFFDLQYDESNNQKNKLSAAGDIVYERVIAYKRIKSLKDDVEMSTANNSNELAGALHRIPKPLDTSSGPHPSCLVREVQIRQRDTILGTGLTLIDTPGLSDKNTTICQNAEACTEEAGIQLIILPFLRRDDGRDTEKLVRRCVRLGLQRKIRFVITKVDNDAGGEMDPSKRLQLDADTRAQLEAAEELSNERKTEEKALEARCEELDNMDQRNDADSLAEKRRGQELARSST